MIRGELYDVAVIGGGVVGCAVARRFTLQGARVILLEKGTDILAGASKGNSAILHTGFDAPDNSVELQCVKAGHAEYLDIHERLNLPLLNTGALVVAWSRDQLARLDGIVAQAHANGVGDACLIDPDETYRREPALGPGVMGAVLVPREYVIDPWSAPYAYLLQAVRNGCEVRFGVEVKNGHFDDQVWILNDGSGAIRAKTVINCAGLYGDLLDRDLLGATEFTIKPRKGQFVVYDKAAAELLSSIVLPVPDERTKGIVLTRTAFGNLLVGPTAEEQDDRADASVDRATLEMLMRKAEELIPGLRGMGVSATYAGIRPASERKEYRIKAHAAQNWITVGGIRSTGLTSSLGIARHVYGLYEDMGRSHEALTDPLWPRVPNLAEDWPRDWTEPGYGEIICHCELVTEREIEAALKGPLAAHSPGALKRRTRATMGRCQGFYCTHRLAELTLGRITPELSKGKADD